MQSVGKIGCFVLSFLPFVETSTCCICVLCHKEAGSLLTVSVQLNPTVLHCNDVAFTLGHVDGNGNCQKRSMQIYLHTSCVVACCEAYLFWKNLI
jgi:hypothetical protein